MVLGKNSQKDLCQKSGRINASARHNFYLSNYKRSTLLNSFCRSRFCYCSLSWMYHFQTLKKKNSLLRKLLRIIYNKNQSEFSALSVRIYCTPDMLNTTCRVTLKTGRLKERSKEQQYLIEFKSLITLALIFTV